jgi:DNA helicase-2/ATP-dependent DNA helicase PcrA
MTMALNSAQMQAVETIDGPLLILAGAGSGKTTVLTHRIGNMIEQDVSPKTILALTFTNKAAAEMRERISLAVGKDKASSIWMMTFHSMCARILRIEASNTNRVTSNFTIYDTADAKSLLKKTIESLGMDSKKVTPQSMLYYISTLKNEMIDFESFKQNKPMNAYIDWKKALEIIRFKIPQDKIKLIQRVFEKYQQMLMVNNAVDFDDLILHTIHLMIENPEVLEKYQNRFKYIMVDEYQDTNHAQYVLIKLFAQKYRNLGVVGDDSQSIYAFRGSDIRNIMEFEKDYPEAKVVMLEENYRCTPHILQAANEVIGKNSSQRKKQLFTSKQPGEKIGYYFAFNEKDEARYITNEILKRIRTGNDYDEFAILYRTNQQSRAFEEAFMRAGIPYKIIGGLNFYDRMEIKDIIAYLSFINNPQDRIKFTRIANLPRRSLSAKTVEALMEASLEKNFWEYLQNPQDLKMTTKAQQGLRDFVQLIKKYRKLAETCKIGQLVSMFIMDSGYVNMLKGTPDEKTEERIQNVSELINLAVEMENEHAIGNLESFLEHVALHSNLDDNSEGKAIQLLTIHSAKGLEFPVVFIAGMEEGLFPHRNSSEECDMEEERRLCYVGITRAKEKLYLVHAKERRVWGKTEQFDPSRFLHEFSEDLVDNPALIRKTRY